MGAIVIYHFHSVSPCTYIIKCITPGLLNELHLHKIRSSADADNGLDAFSGQSRSTNMVPFWVHCDFSISM